MMQGAGNGGSNSLTFSAEDEQRAQTNMGFFPSGSQQNMPSFPPGKSQAREHTKSWILVPSTPSNAP